MKRFATIAGLVASLALAACTTSQTRSTTTNFARPPSGAPVVLIEPDVKLSILTAVGAPERRADWSEAGQRHILTAISQAVSAKGYRTVVVDPDTMQGGQSGQVLRLFEQVGAAILTHHYGGFTLPSMQGRFDYTLGQGVRTLAGDSEAGYAVFVYAEGCFSSGGRMAVVMLAAVAGASLPTCQQQLVASLVSVETGEVVWFNFAIAGPADDMREEAGARTLVSAVFRDAPL